MAAATGKDDPDQAKDMREAKRPLLLMSSLLLLLVEEVGEPSSGPVGCRGAGRAFFCFRCEPSSDPVFPLVELTMVHPPVFQIYSLAAGPLTSATKSKQVPNIWKQERAGSRIGEPAREVPAV